MLDGCGGEGLSHHRNYSYFPSWIHLGFNMSIWIKLLLILSELAIALLIVYFAYELIDLGKQYYDRNKNGF